MRKLQSFQKKYPKFIYENYSCKISKNNLEIFFDFRIGPNIRFAPKIVIENVNKKRMDFLGKKILDNLIFHLGLMEIPSYWKATCSPEIVIKANPLNSEQIKWWKDLIIRGLSQFFYENKINFTRPNFFKISGGQEKTNFTSIKTNKLLRFDINNSTNQMLVPVGGGKDSIVTLELLKRVGKNIQCFSLNPTEAAQKIMSIAGCKKPIIVKRKIDRKLLELNQKGYLNGHTPFSAYLAFLSVLCAVIFDCKFIAFSNERSSNEGNIKYLGKIINHQWSKSFDFEKKFKKYLKKYLIKDAEYFSFLRPLYEIQIAQLFSKYPKYFSSFLSCNEAYKTASGTKKPTERWCCNCPKCLFVFTALYPFIGEKKLIKIFGENLFDKKELLPVMQELIGERKFKPFECVGTKKESLIIFYLSYKKYIGATYVNLPILLRYFEKNILPKYPGLDYNPAGTQKEKSLDLESKKIMNSWDNQHNLPKEFEKILKTFEK